MIRVFSRFIADKAATSVRGASHVNNRALSLDVGALHQSTASLIAGDASGMCATGTECRDAGSSFRLSRFGTLRKKLGTLLPLFFPFILASLIFFGLGSILQSGPTLVKRELAPLRRIVSRELVTYQPDARVRYYIYSLRDRLECGHEDEHYLYNGLRDLLNAYSQNPLMRAKRHRCHPCAALVAVKKPVASVLLARKAAGAA